jgi:hypothetical protein
VLCRKQKMHNVTGRLQHEAKGLQEWKEVKAAFGTDHLEIKPGIGYKQLNGYIAKLSFGTENNLDRYGIKARQWSKFRAKDVKCVSIWCLTTKTWYKKEIKNIFFDFESSLRFFATYEEGKEVVYDNKYSDDINQVCAGGIHFFLTLEAAFFYDRSVQHIVFECPEKECSDLFSLDSNGKFRFCCRQHYFKNMQQLWEYLGFSRTEACNQDVP